MRNVTSKIGTGMERNVEQCVDERITLKEILNKNILIVWILTLNSNLFLDLIYHVRFKRYLNCIEPQIQKFIKIQIPLLKI